MHRLPTPTTWLAGLVLLCLAGAGCSRPSEDTGSVGRLTREGIRDSVLSAMDLEADPCQDFYQYACGNWIATQELPADESRWSRSFSEINIRNREILKTIVEETAASPDPELAKVGGFFKACMDEEGVEAAGVAPLQPMLERIGGVNDTETFFDAVGQLQAQGVGALLSSAILADFKNPDINITNFFQGGLGLPSRDYYFDADKSAQLAAYGKHVENMLALSGRSSEEAAAEAAAVVAFETELARVSRPPAEMRQVERLYNKIDVEGLQQLTPSLPWGRMFAVEGYPDIQDLNVGTPEFFERLETLVPGTDPSTLRSYLRFHYLSARAGQLPQAFVDEDFGFYGRTLQGQQELRPRWRRCVNAVDASMGELLGRAFVERQFPGDSKEIALSMISGIERAFEGGLAELSWMDDTTRGRAVEKMDAILNKIGYPDKWRDYSGLRVDSEDYFGNTVRARQFEFAYEMDKAGKEVDPTEWGMTPPEVNAYYNPLVNEIVFPAGILQDPFFHRDFPLAMNFGGIGMVMGHELTHGFDDMGSKFDPQGKMEQWWEDEAIQRFAERTACVDELYSGYEVQPDLYVNGRLTLGENIADLGGIKEAFDAYRQHVEEHGEEPPLTEELTNEQLFFVSFAQTWCQKSSVEADRMQVASNPHSPARFRVIGPLASFPQFAETFSCAEGTPMNPTERCEVW